MARSSQRRRSPAEVELGAREHYEDAVLYDYEYRRRRDDVRFYRRLARRRLGASGSVLELAVGTARVATALARDGHEVVGIDTSPAMLTRAEARIAKLPRGARARIALQRADMRDFALERRFPLVISAFNSFEHLYSAAEVTEALERVAAHLTPRGVFAFDVQLPDLEWLCRDSERRWSRTRFTHPVTGERLVYTTNHVYDPVTQICAVRIYYQRETGEEHAILLSQRKFFPAELVALIEHAGFEVTERYGDFEDEPLSAAAENQVLVCRLRRSPRAAR